MSANIEYAIILNLPEGSYTAIVGTNGESLGGAVNAAFEIRVIFDILTPLTGLRTRLFFG